MSLANISKTIYNSIFRRTSTFVLTCVVLAYPFERAFNTLTEQYFRQINKGKLYDDIKKKPEPGEEE